MQGVKDIRPHNLIYCILAYLEWNAPTVKSEPAMRNIFLENNFKIPPQKVYNI